MSTETLQSNPAYAGASTGLFSRPLLRGGRFVQGALPFLLPLAIALLWLAATQFRWVSDLILPPPSLVWSSAVDLVASGQLFSEVGVSLTRIFYGLLIGGTLGIVTGIAMARSPTLEAYIGPTIRVIWLVPALGWLPFLMLFLGVGETLKFVMIAKTCFMPLLVTSYEGTRALPQRYLEVAKVLELPRRTTLFKVIIPSTLPSLFAGLRLALSKGWQALVVVELIASSAGIGYLMNWGRKLFYLDIVIVTMIVVGLIGWLIDFAMVRIENRLTAWQKQSVA